MVKISTRLKAVLASAILTGTLSYGAHAADAANPQVFKAAHGVLLEVGSKKVAGYYINTGGICDFTLMTADLPDSDGRVSAELTRVNLPIKAGSNARIYTSEGKALDLYCTLGAKFMTLRTVALDQTASVTK